MAPPSGRAGVGGDRLDAAGRVTALAFDLAHQRELFRVAEVAAGADIDVHLLGLGIDEEFDAGGVHDEGADDAAHQQHHREDDLRRDGGSPAR